jgi:Protein of unknown function (DUF2971)
MLKSRKRRQSNPLALERMFDRPVNDTLKIPPSEAPKILYHYTTWKGAEGIISSQRFWATAHDCTNDEAELVAADSIIIEIVRELRRNAVHAAAEVLDLFLRNYAHEQVTLVIPVYLTCFSNLRDDSEQWRRYGDNGRGVCLGLRMLNEQKPQGPDLGDGLVKVDYSKASWRENVREHMGQVCSFLSYRNASPAGQKLALSALYRVAAFTSIMAKQAAWEVEQEFRHVTIVHPGSGVQPRERQSGGKTIRYLPVALRDSGKRIAFAEIITGPNQNAEDARERLKLILAEHGYAAGDLEYPEIMASSLPPWAASSG